MVEIADAEAVIVGESPGAGGGGNFERIVRSIVLQRSAIITARPFQGIRSNAAWDDNVIDNTHGVSCGCIVRAAGGDVSIENATWSGRVRSTRRIIRTRSV